ncbi:MAG: MazG family protein [Candidatus Nanopelagicales bacterium]
MPDPKDYLDRGLVGLIDLMDLLRSSEGCPWDVKQTHETLAEFLIEETYELIDAINSKDKDSLREELGDLLLQIVFHAKIASEDKQNGFDINQVADSITAKLISRHPHVFKEPENLVAEEVKANWEKLKANEKNRESAFEGVPKELPALLFASKILSRIDKYEPDFELSPLPSVEKLIDEQTSEADLGKLLLKLVEQSKKLGLEPELALRKAVLALDSRFKS